MEPPAGDDRAGGLRHREDWITPSPPMHPPALQSVRVWDLPTRLFHWTLALTLAGSLVTGKLGGAWITWHFKLGLAAGALLLFRLAWGLVGGRWSRFTQFAVAPSTLWRYLRGRPRPGERFDVGHNPLGSLSVIAMLAVLAVQVGTGLVADDEIANVGPLNRFVAGATGLAATAWHKGWGQGLVIALVILHLGAVAYHAGVRRERLVGAMLHGDKPLPPGTPASRDDLPARAGALLLALACAAAAWAVARWGG